MPTLTKQQLSKLRQARKELNEHSPQWHYFAFYTLPPLSQKDVAIQLDISQSTFHRFEQGERNPSYELLERWCKLLGVELEIIEKKVKVGKGHR